MQEYNSWRGDEKCIATKAHKTTSFHDISYIRKKTLSIRHSHLVFSLDRNETLAYLQLNSSQNALPCCCSARIFLCISYIVFVQTMLHGFHIAAPAYYSDLIRHVALAEDVRPELKRSVLETVAVTWIGCIRRTTTLRPARLAFGDGRARQLVCNIVWQTHKAHSSFFVFYVHGHLTLRRAFPGTRCG